MRRDPNALSRQKNFLLLKTYLFVYISIVVSNLKIVNCYSDIFPDGFKGGLVWVFWLRSMNGFSGEGEEGTW
jgi:hypothetical protein